PTGTDIRDHHARPNAEGLHRRGRRLLALPLGPIEPGVSADIHHRREDAPRHGMRRLTGYCFTSSTRRFLARPSAVSLGATGESGPEPAGLRRAGGIPCLPVNSPTTAAARRCERPRL